MPQENPGRRGKTTLVPYYDENGKLQGWVREERKNTKSHSHRFRSHFTHQQVEDTSQLAFYWISDKLPGKRGSLDAVTPEKGKQSSFKCAGIIQCKAMVCTLQIAPGTNIARQIEGLCTCGSPLRHRSCKVECSVVFYRDGAVFENSGPHNHSKYLSPRRPSLSWERLNGENLSCNLS
ncbi:hypothetical protein C8J57DRAFT_1585725 [Mycena rebaudengoi]|nr:hypothetical protein C8J57DRAFT_1585725 [Mycena rebaudengoi]